MLALETLDLDFKESGGNGGHVKGHSEYFATCIFI